MFKRALLAVAILGMVSTPVTAELIGGLSTVTPRNDLQELTPGGGTIGVLNTLGTFASSNLMLYPNPSDMITVTFAIHWPYITPVLVQGLRHGLNWDTNEVVLLGAGPAGPFSTNNIGTTPAAGAALINAIVSPASGTEGVVGIEELVASGSSFIIFGSDTVPFARFTFHAAGPFAADGLADIIMPEPGTTVNGGQSFGVGILFDFGTFVTFHTSFSSSPSTFLVTSTGFINFGSSRPSFGVELKPEPASAALLGFGALALTGGFWRRRRRQA